MDEITDWQSYVQITKDVSSNFISSLSEKMFSFGLGLMLLDQTKSAISFGVESIVYPLVSLLFLVPVGNLVDKYNHKLLLFLSSVIRLIALIVFAAYMTVSNVNGALIAVVIFLIVNSVSTNLNDTAYSSSIHELVNQQNIQRLNSLTQGSIAIASILSPVLGVSLYSLLGFKGLIYIEVLATIGTLLILISMKFNVAEKAEKTSVKASAMLDFKVALTYISSRYLIKWIIILATVVNFVFTSLTIGMPFIIKSQLHLGNSAIGIFEMGLAAGMLLGSLIMSLVKADRGFSKRLIISFLALGLELAVVGMLFNFVQDSRTLLISGTAIMTIIGLTLVVMNITGKVKLQETIPTTLLGRVMSLMTTANASIVPIGTLCYTALFQVTKNGSLILMVSGILLFTYASVIMLKATSGFQKELE
ncbi:MFS transporter [Lactiplantibacillus herbarum]|uniref:MFS transporter n=1 Tax=Lactiplantibacillus herbarum TaxID=1670446 RepID=UPI00064E8475|nr:MFS transporter [Lactiplantibacillus herbarum]